MLKHFLHVLLVICSFNAFAGGIKGTVIDSKNNSPLTGVIVSLRGTDKGTVTDIDGNYEISNLPNGSYDILFTYVTYTDFKQNITVAGKDLILDVKLIPASTELKENVVKATKITGTENAVINEIKSSNTIVSGTSASQISKSLDRNAADVVKRIPGVTIQDDRFIVIRGLPDRYNTVWLNDASTPSSEADKKAFSFDIIPAGLIDRVLIYKTPSPDLPGDFAGGMVKVYTTSIADKNQLTVSLSTSSREYSTGTTLNYNQPSKTDRLGYDDGKRSIPAIIPDNINTKNSDYKTNIGAWSKSFGNDWIINTKNTSPDLRFSLAASNVWKIRKIKIGNTLGVSYASTFTNTQIHRQDWDSTSRNYNYIDQKSVSNVNVGLMDNVGVVIGNSRIEFKNLYNQIGTSSLTVRNSVNDTGSTLPVERAYAMGYQSRATYASELTGSHKNKADTRKYNWTLGYSDLFKNEPDLRRIKYAKTGSDTVFKAPVAGNVDVLNGGGRYYATLYEHACSFNHQITQKISVSKKFSFELSAGNFIEYKARSFRVRQLGYFIKSGANALALTHLPVNQIFADTNVGSANNFKIGEVTNNYDRYNGQNELIASFVSVKVPLGKLTVFGGARYEYNIQSIQTFVNQDSIAPEVKTKFMLPSVNAAYNFSEKSLLRFAYGKTLNRPEFREWAPIVYYDFDELAGNKGSLFKTTASRSKSVDIGDTLKVAQIHNLDFRYELYPSAGELIQVGVFYKSFTDPIQRVIVPGTGGDSKAYTFTNANSAECYGLELDMRKNLGWVDSKIGTNIFKDFTMVGNLAFAKSKVTIDTTQLEGAIPSSSLQGQSPYIVNFGVYYQNLHNNFQGSLLYNVFGPRMYALGNTDAGGESIGELPFQSLDVTISKLFHKLYIVNIGIQNLLGARVSYVKDINKDNKFDSKNDIDYKSYYPGRYYSIGLKVKL